MPKVGKGRRGDLRPGGRGGSTREWRRVREIVLKRDAHTCVYCGGEGGSVDHVIPYSRGGNDHIDNLVTACMRCNRAKGDRDPRFWKPSDTSPTPLASPSPRGTVTTHTSHV